jgi:hypothetical protein
VEISVQTCGRWPQQLRCMGDHEITLVASSHQNGTAYRTQWAGLANQNKRLPFPSTRLDHNP